VKISGMVVRISYRNRVKVPFLGGGRPGLHYNEATMSNPTIGGWVLRRTSLVLPQGTAAGKSGVRKTFSSR